MEKEQLFHKYYLILAEATHAAYDGHMDKTKAKLRELAHEILAEFPDAQVTDTETHPRDQQSGE